MDNELRSAVAAWLRARLAVECPGRELDEMTVDGWLISNFGRALQQYRDENGRWPDPIGEYVPFPHDEAKFDAAVREFARRRATGDWFPEEVANNPEAFEEYVEFTRTSGIGKMLRSFHDMIGRYPTYEEAFPPDGLRLILGSQNG